MSADRFTSSGEARWELHAVAGRAVLVGAAPETNGAAQADGARQEIDPDRLRLPESLVSALHEWAHVADTVERSEGAVGESAAEVVGQRGRQLAIRLAVETGGEVGYLDPVSGRLNRVGRRRPSRPRTPASQPPASPSLPTPWGTGLAVSAIIAGIVVTALVVVTLGLAEVNAVLAGLVNIAVAAGFAPSIWLGRRVPVWRWVALGTAVGVVLAWMVLLLSALG